MPGTRVALDLVPRRHPRPRLRGTSPACRDLTGASVLDVIYLVVTVVLFVIVGLVAMGVENL